MALGAAIYDVLTQAVNFATSQITLATPERVRRTQTLGRFEKTVSRNAAIQGHERRRATAQWIEPSMNLTEDLDRSDAHPRERRPERP